MAHKTNQIWGVAIKHETGASLHKAFIDEPGENSNVAYQKARAAAIELQKAMPEVRIYVGHTSEVKNAAHLADDIVFSAIMSRLDWEKVEEI